MGKVAMWHFEGHLDSQANESQDKDKVWSLLAPSDIGHSAVDLKVVRIIQPHTVFVSLLT